MIRFFYKFSLSFIFFISTTLPAFAISDSFTIGTVIGNDSTPPTVPTPVLAIPVSSSQIDVSWGASTDNQSLSGYRLFRDSVQVATTTLLTYSDTGLAASTTYTYTVQAFDWIMNVSSTSVPVSTTTLQAPSVSTSTGPSVSGSIQLKLIQFSIDTSEDTADIAFSTNIYAKYTFRWGKTDAYEMGSVQADIFKKNHHIVLSNLEPGTTYQFELVAFDRFGRRHLLKKDTFSTKNGLDTTAPPNVFPFEADVEDSSVYLSWENPEVDDFWKVRLVRNHHFYPRDITDGFIVYEGGDESFLDIGALATYGGQYYTIFAYDIYGNISSGSVLFVQNNAEYYFNDIAQDAEGYTPYSPDDASSTTIDYSTSTTDTATTDNLTLDFFDVDVLQYDLHVDHASSGVVHVYDDAPVSFEIPYNRLPEHLKAIVVTVDIGKPQEASYLLRIDTNKSVYKATIPTVTTLGSHPLLFEIYDYTTKQLTTFPGELYVMHATTSAKQVNHSLWREKIQQHSLFLFPVFIFILFLLFLLFGFIRRTED